MARYRIRKYSRRMSSQYKANHAPLIISIIAFLLLSIVISVVIGLSLGERADENKLSEKFDFGRDEYTNNRKTVSMVEAYHFPKGASASDYVSLTIYDMSVCIRHRDGVFDYFFETEQLFSLGDMKDPLSFGELCSTAQRAGGRICAYMYVSYQSYTDEYVREAVKAYEISIISEASRKGADDILLLGLEADAENISEAESYLARAAEAAGTVPLGVSVGEETVLLTENEEYIAARLRNSCDYLALDLTHLTVDDGESLGNDSEGNKLPSVLEETLERMEYYIKAYNMRVLFSREESKIYIPALKLGVTDLQIVAE